MPLLRLLLLAALCSLPACVTGPSRSPTAERLPIAGLAIVHQSDGEAIRPQVRDTFLARLQKKLYRPGGFLRGNGITLRWKLSHWDEDTTELFVVEVTYVDATGKVLAHRFLDGSQSRPANEARTRDVAPTGILPFGDNVGVVHGVSMNAIVRTVENTADDVAAYTFEHFTPASP